MDVYFVTEKDPSTSLKYVLALLNSNAYYFWLYHKGKRKGEALELYQRPLSEIPIKRISNESQERFVALVDQILRVRSKSALADVSFFQREIDRHVYSLFDFTPEEIALIESSLPS